MRLTVATVAVALFSIPFVLLLVFVLSSFAPLNDLDESVARQFHAYVLADPGYTRFLNVATEVFGPTTWRVLVALAAVWLWLRGARRPAIWAVVTITASGLLNLAVKGIVDRARPVLPDPVSWAPGASFPSGHAMGAATGTCVLVLLLLPYLKGRLSRLALWAVAAVITVFVAYSRVALGVHWFSDVVAGVALGVVVVAGTAAGFESWRRDEGRRPVEPLKEGVEPEAF
ncbi:MULTISPECIES: phosphatase PAP2 family protein [Streptosporangium]|uniref:Undecaprenyl-diphosphatase n=1 Tax=Streptosporangium brasiliense TaxID=47480 RepID=A0ABT9R6S5_9ACTN|nr:phosphatase PAP2 family protein [Streptosporangium brasiliense]MDP9864576.1 undecaprenyl-diphosphatase [Streptosporangium brasiliense]